jgi:hypothetical protein
VHAYRRDQPGDPAEDHGEDHHGAVGRRYLGHCGRPGGHRRRRPLQRPGEADEKPLCADRAGDGQRRTQDGAQPVEARVGPHQPSAQPAQQTGLPVSRRGPVPSRVAMADPAVRLSSRFLRRTATDASADRASPAMSLFPAMT